MRYQMRRKKVISNFLRFFSVSREKQIRFEVPKTRASLIIKLNPLKRHPIIK